jgi:ankyrin repeat protein
MSMKRTRTALPLSRVALMGFTATIAMGPARPANAAPPPGPPRPTGKLCQELFRAVTFRDRAAVKALLARGADPNARNVLRFTPLQLAAISGQVEVAKLLLAAGAKLDGQSPYGSALTFAELGGSVPMIEFLLARGINVNPPRPDGITVLMLAARNGHAQTVQQLLAKKAPLAATDNDGGTALIYAARNGRTEVARILLAKGAAIDAVDSRGWSALTHAAVNGHRACTELLLEQGADPNLRDKKGRTPLIVAASYGDDPLIPRALLDKGADPQSKDPQDRSALSLALARGHEESAQILRERGAEASTAANAGPEKTARAAIDASLPLMQRSMRVFMSRTGCVSCHQEGIGRMATGLALERGFSIDTPLAREQVKRISGMFTELRPLHLRAIQDPRAMKDVPFTEVNELTPSYGYALAGMAAHKQPANLTLSAAALVLARQQAGDGHWQFFFHRVPLQSSYFTMTALAIRAMKAYAPKDRAGEIAQRIARAKRWLLTAPAETTENRASRLLGLKWAGASLEEERKTIEELRAGQRPDGGWAELAGMRSDAYATGQALFALNQAGGVAVTDPVYQQGVRFLLQTQDDDGSWFLNKRAIPANDYFDAEFPHGQSQYASFSATCWATMALMLTVDAPPPARQTAGMD